jgi:exodeoxyribonuclease-5
MSDGIYKGGFQPMDIEPKTEVAPAVPEKETLSTEQQAAVDAAIKSVGDGKLFKIGGYAGTGKTTVAKHIAADISGCMPCAFTGKAAYRLREKGLPATTIHSLIYQRDDVRDEFILKMEVEGDWFLIDEGSMISKQIWEDLNTFGLPILLLGDPGQLEPVGNDPKLMHTPDVILEEIHRQKEGNGIIQYATDIRRGINPNDFYGDYVDNPDVEGFHGVRPTYADLEWADVVLCGFNRTRVKINQIMRKQKEFTGLLEEDERIICLRNDREQGVFNGQMFTVNRITKTTDIYTWADCLDDMGVTRCLKLFNEQFGRASAPQFREIPKGAVAADYGYCITTHKSQGSEWDNVLVIDEQCPKIWDPVRWRYTAITRASKKLKYYFKK